MGPRPGSRVPVFLGGQYEIAKPKVGARPAPWQGLAPSPQAWAVTHSIFCRRWCRGNGMGAGVRVGMGLPWWVNPVVVAVMACGLLQMHRCCVQQIQLFGDELQVDEGVGNGLLLGQDVGGGQHLAEGE